MFHLSSKYQQFTACTDPGFLLVGYFQFHCVLRNSAFYFFKKTLLTILTLHVVTACDCTLSESQCHQHRSVQSLTVIGTFAIVLFAVITVCSLQIQLALLKPLPNFFTLLLFCSHAFQFVYNLEKILETIRSLSCSIV